MIFYCVAYLHTKGVKMAKIDYYDSDSDTALLQFCLKQNYTLAVKTRKEAMRLSSLLLPLLQKEEYKNSDKTEYPILIVNKNISKDTILIPAVVANRLENIFYRTSVCKAWYTHIVPRNIAFDENTLFFYRGVGFTLDGFTTMVQDNEVFCDFIKNRRTD